MDLGQSIRTGVKWLIIGNTGSRLMEFAFGVVLARLLVPADFGMIVTIQIFTGFVSMLASGGMGQALIRAKHVGEKDFNAVFTLQLVVAIVVYLGFYFVAPLFAEFFENPLYKDLLPVSAMMLLIRPVGYMHTSWLNREMDFKKRSIISISVGIITGLSSITMAWYGMGVWSLTLAGLMGGLISNILLSWVTPLKLKLNFDFAVMRKHGSYGSKIVANDFFSHIRRESLKLVLSKMAGPAFLGLFNKADSLHRLPYQTFAQPVAQPVFRAMSKIQDDLDQTKYMFYRVITLLMAYILPFYIGLWWVAESFVVVVYGEKWLPAAGPLQILSLAGFFYIIIRPSGMLLMAQDRLVQEMIAQGVIIVFTICACLIGLEWGLEGVSWAFLISQIFNAIYFYILVYQTLPTRVMDLVKAIMPGLQLNASLFIVLFVADYLITEFLTASPVLYLMIMVGVGGLTYIASFFLLPIAALESDKVRIFNKFDNSLILVKKSLIRFTLVSIKLLISFILLLSLSFGLMTLIKKYSPPAGFIDYPLPIKESHRLFDLGIVDANGDGHLDIYTSNHHFRQVMLIADGLGGYHDVLSAWGLDQNLDFPKAELAYKAPILDKAGLYIYWFGAQLLIRAHKLEEIGSLQGTIHVYDPIKIAKNDGFTVNNEHKVIAVLQWSTITDTTFSFATDKSAYLRLKPGGQGLPSAFKISGDIKPEQIYVGLGKVSPISNDFSLAVQDRHAMVWADYNSDGGLDVFISRGALGGSLLAVPEDVRKTIQDELLVRNVAGKFNNITLETGISKRGCSGRHAKWLDFNSDGLLDLYINCYDRNNAYGTFPKQLYIQNDQGKLQDQSVAVGIGMPDQQIGSFVWFDIEQDGDLDLVTLQNEGFFLYRNDNGYLTQESIVERPLSGTSIGDSTKGEWLYDGKLIARDYDTDGDLDLFASSKRGNFLFVNNAGNFTSIDPLSVGLPEKSLNASWVDYDNDGLPDLYAIPQGIFKQNLDHSFFRADILAFHHDQYLAAVSNWFDLDNDGHQDLILALNNNPSFKNWWEFNKKPERGTTWPIKAYRNVGNLNHWLQIELVGLPGNRQAIGAQVTVITADGQQLQVVGSSEGSFFSQGHYRLYYGLGKNKQVVRIKIQWPDGKEQEFENILADRLLLIEQTPVNKLLN